MKKPKSLNKNYMRSICQLEGWDWKGDLVEALLQIKDDNKYDYWPSHPVEKARFCEMYKSNQQNMEEALGYFGDVIKIIRRRFEKFCDPSNTK